MPPRPAFGYIRIGQSGSAADRDILQKQLTSFAERENYQLGQIFIEANDGTSSAYAALIDAACAARITAVLVPSADHFGHLESLRGAMIRQIEAETGARVVTVLCSQEHEPH